jgi:hypothetical protein
MDILGLNMTSKLALTINYLIDTNLTILFTNKKNQALVKKLLMDLFFAGICFMVFCKQQHLA